MNWKKLLFLALVLSPVLLRADQAQDQLFQQGNAQYAKGRYKEAVALYRQVVDAGYESAAVYLNLGNAYFKSDDLPDALLYYGKANKLSPADEDIRFNIRFANSKTIDKLEEAPEFFLSRWWDTLLLSFSRDTLAIWAVITLIAAAVLFLLYLFSRALAVRKIGFYAALGFLFISLAAQLLANRQANYFNTQPEAIVFSPSVTVKSAPGKQGKPLFTIHEGIKVKILENSATWIKIRLANAGEGWIAAANVRRI